MPRVIGFDGIGKAATRIGAGVHCVELDRPCIAVNRPIGQLHCFLREAMQAEFLRYVEQRVC
jgi:hypothetical protein